MKKKIMSIVLMLTLMLTSITIAPKDVQAASATNRITIFTNDYWTVTMSNSDNYIGTVNGRKIGKTYEKDCSTATITGATLKIKGTKQGGNIFYIYRKSGSLARTVYVTVKDAPSITSQTNQYADVGTSRNSTNIYLYEGDKATASISTSGWYSSITWASSNTSVATVSGTGTTSTVATKTGIGTDTGATSNIAVTLKAVTDGSRGTYTVTKNFTVHVYKKPVLDVIMDGASVGNSYTLSKDETALVRVGLTNADKLKCERKVETNSAYVGYIKLTPKTSSLWELSIPKEGGLSLGSSAKFTVTTRFLAGDAVTENNGAYTISKEIGVTCGLSTANVQYIQLKNEKGNDIVTSRKIIYLRDGMPGYKDFDVTDTSGTISSVDFTVQDENIVKVTNAIQAQSPCKYRLLPAKEGITTLTVMTKVSGKVHIRELMVIVCSNVIDLKVDDMSLLKGETGNITYLGTTLKNMKTYNEVSLNPNKLTVTSSDSSIVEIKDGQVVAKKNGTAEITVKYSYYYFTKTYPDGDISQGLQEVSVKDPTTTFKVNVYSLITDLKFSISYQTMNVGKELFVAPTVFPQNESVNTNYTWTSSDTSVATVEADGKVIGKKAGKAVITATTRDGSNKSASYTVFVKTDSVKGIKAISNKDGIYVTWNQNPDASTYKIYRATSENGTYNQIGYSTGLEYIDKSAKWGNTYYYKVLATPSIGVQYESDFSDAVGISHKLTTPKITNFKKKKKGCKFKVKNASYDGYIIYVGKRKNVKKIYGTSRKKTISVNIKKKGKYYVRVRAYKTVDGKFVYSDYSKVKKITIKNGKKKKKGKKK